MALAGFRLIICLAVMLGAAPILAAATDMSFNEAQQALARAETLLAQGQHQAALSCLDQGLALLGSAYYSPELVDDTAVKLAAAEDLQGKGEPQKAAFIKQRILTARLELYKRKYGL